MFDIFTTNLSIIPYIFSRPVHPYRKILFSSSPSGYKEIRFSSLQRFAHYKLITLYSELGSTIARVGISFTYISIQIYPLLVLG